MIRILGTVFAALIGLAFGSFLNVCLSRWPQGESIVKPGSHCRNCDHALAWWENIPLLSWLLLRGRCRKCHAPISWRYPLVELAVGALWATVAWQFLALALDPNVPAVSPFLHYNLYSSLFDALGKMLFYWLLVALAALDAEHLWLPNWLTFPGIALGIVSSVAYRVAVDRSSDAPPPLRLTITNNLVSSVLVVLAAAALVLLIRWLYWLVRRREGIGLGDAKLMAMLAAWLGLPGALLSFGLGAILGSITALILLAIPSVRKSQDSWGAIKLPLGTFLCVGGIVSALWGQPILAAYLRWAGF